MRDLLVLGFIFAFVPLALSNTFVGYLLWCWTGLIALNEYLYGFMVPVPYVQVFALITLASWMWLKDPEKKPFQANRTTTIFLIFLTHGLLCALLAYPDLFFNWEIFGNLAKTILFCVLMPLLVTSRFRLHALVLVVVFATAFHGVLDGLKFLASGGAHNARGLAKFGDNNQLALVLLLIIPMLYYLYQYSASRLVRLGFIVGILLTVLAIVATASRGGLIGLGALALWLILKSRRKFLGILLVTICGILVVQLAPESWTARMQTIKAADEDSSFMGRVVAWKVSSAIAVANPIFGGGFRVIQSHQVWNQFKSSEGLLGFVDTPVLSRSGVAAHSIWFEVMADLGFVGFFIFIALIINAFRTRWEIRQLVDRGGTSFQWAADLADLLGATLFVYLVSGSALSAAYFEMLYIVMMMLEVTKQQLMAALHSVPTEKVAVRYG